MPEVHFVGQLESAQVEISQISVTWAVVPGSASWVATNGSCFGETQTSSLSSLNGLVMLGHPIDVRFESSSIEGWPFFVCEIWDRSHDNERSFIGCGSVWLPTQCGEHSVDVHIWRPVSHGLQGLTEKLLPCCPDLKAIRELTVSPFLRSHVLADSVGTVNLSVTVVVSDMASYGVMT